MATVAERLRQAREAQQLSLHQVAESTKIKTDHIRALEAGDYDVFSAPVYIRGFVRSYAAVLKLDLDETLSALETELSGNEKFRDPPRFGGSRRGPLDRLMFQFSKLRWSRVWPAALVAILFLSVWGFMSARKAKRARDPLSGLGSGVYEPRPGSGAEYLPVPTNAIK
jgi:cytoskeletal protein RodZ